jgi:hypothetical protein
MPSRDCAAIRQLLPSYAAGQLDASQRATVDAHLATCDDCRAELRQWRALANRLVEAEIAIPPDTGAARGLAAIRARLGRRAGANTLEPFERKENHAMPNQDDSIYPGNRDRVLYRRERTRYSTPDDQREPNGRTSRLPAPPTPQRRITPWVAAGSVVVFLALIAGLFYWFSPARNPIKPAIATPRPVSGIWHIATDAPRPPASIVFSPSTPRTGYLCAYPSATPTSSAQWLYRSDDGGLTWRSLGGITTPTVATPATFACGVYVDARDDRDVLVELVLWANASGSPAPPESETLWRSHDGGATWLQLSMPQFFRGWTNIIVAGSRLIGLGTDANQAVPFCSTNPNAPAPHQVNDLVASDDGGRSWSPIGQSLINQGLSIADVSSESGGQLLQNNGDAIVVHTFCAAQQSSGTFVTEEADWISHDGGATWAKISTGGGTDITSFTFTPAKTGGTYGVAIDLGSGADTTTLPIIRYSADSGSSWKTLPSLSKIPGSQEAGGLQVRWVIALPDGTALASFDVGGSPGEPLSSVVYAVDPQSAHPTWKQFAARPTGDYRPANWPLARTAQGEVLWGFYVVDPQPYNMAYLAPLP